MSMLLLCLMLILKTIYDEKDRPHGLSSFLFTYIFKSFENLTVTLNCLIPH